MANENPLTANADFEVFLEAGREYRLDISDDLGSGTFSLEYIDADGGRRTVEGTAIAIDTSIIFVAPSMRTFVVLTGATTPTLCFNLTKVL